MADLHISKESIYDLFSSMKDRKFIIPDYQRPYKWDVEKCEILWNDIENFVETKLKNDMYFLGTIVSFENEDKNPEIIDGQQRITSFMLLLRAFYSKLEGMPSDDDVNGLKNKLAPCIWDTDEISGKVTDFTKTKIVSEVATDDDKATLKNILETGDADSSQKDNYSLNYLFFKEKCDSYAQKNPMKWKELCVAILNNCIILPIKCESQDTALTIFSTLNDRGLPLDDSDIFKAQLYKLATDGESKKNFTVEWKLLSEICDSGKITINDVFRYYSHFIRANNNETQKEIALRRFYSNNKYERLKHPNLMIDLIDLAEFWRYINTGYKYENEELSYEISSYSKKILHCLSFYPNEYWKYVVSVFFIKNRSDKLFNLELEKLLLNLLAFFYAKFIVKPTVNAIKEDVYDFCISLKDKKNLNKRFSIDNDDVFLSELNKNASSKLTKGLLLIHSYLYKEQKDVIEGNIDIEHIFPKKWQNTNYNGWSSQDAKLHLERLGNKIIFERKLNIQAGNGYFSQKKSKYSASKIYEVIELSEYPNNDWIKDDIESRDKKVKDNLLKFFKKYLP